MYSILQFVLIFLCSGGLSCSEIPPLRRTLLPWLHWLSRLQFWRVTAVHSVRVQSVSEQFCPVGFIGSFLPYVWWSSEVLFRKLLLVFGKFSSVHSLSCVWLFATPWTAACQASLSSTNPQSLLKLISIELVMPSNHLIICHPPLPLPSIFPSIRVFSSESVLHIRWPKYWSFSFNISPSNQHSGLISFRMDWLDLLAVQGERVHGTLKSLLQHHSSKASILHCSAFFIAWLSHPYVTNGKIIALTRQTFVGKVMSLLFNMLSRLVITFLPRSKHLLISWLQSPSAVILEPKKIGKTLCKPGGCVSAHCPAACFGFASLGSWCKPTGAWVGECQQTHLDMGILVISACIMHMLPLVHWKISLFFLISLCGRFSLLPFKHMWT